MSEIILRPDGKGRITLGAIADNVSSYRVTIAEDGKVILRVLSRFLRGWELRLHPAP